MSFTAFGDYLKINVILHIVKDKLYACTLDAFTALRDAAHKLHLVKYFWVFLKCFYFY